MVSTKEIAETIATLNGCEKKMLVVVGRLNMSTSVNKKKETILKKLSDNDRKNCDKSIKSLLAKGLIFKYRNKNYGASKLGGEVAIALKEKDLKEKYKDLSRILMII